jgi:hypothetical protein
MNLTDDEVMWISFLLHQSKSKLINEFDEIRSIKQKIHSKARELIAKKSQSIIKPGKFS